MNVFVICDPTTPTLTTLLQSIRYLPELNQSVSRWILPGLDSEHRPWPVEIVYQELLSADHVIALLDHPNANVGWEVGMALGRRKSVRLGHILREWPAWADAGPLAGWDSQLVGNIEDLASMLAFNYPEFDVPTPSSVARPPLLLCPDGTEGSALRAAALATIPKLKLLGDQGRMLRVIPQLLEQYSVIYWVISAYAEGSDSSHGEANAAHAIMAGLARELHKPVRVFRSAGAPLIRDVRPHEHVFDSVDHFVSQLRRAAADQDIPPPDGQPLTEPRLQDVLPGCWFVRSAGLGQATYELTASPPRFAAQLDTNRGRYLVEGRWEASGRKLSLRGEGSPYVLSFEFSDVGVYLLSGVCLPADPAVWQRIH